MIAAAEVMVLTDAASALVSFTNILRPGGTLATRFYGRPIFSDAKLFTTLGTMIDRPDHGAQMGQGDSRQWTAEKMGI